MLYALIFLPYLYVFAACTYGVAAIIRRLYLRGQFSTLSPGRKAEWISVHASQELGARQIAALVFSVIFLVSSLALYIQLSFPSGTGLGLFALVGLTITPPFIVGFQWRSVWNIRRVFIEEAMLRGKNMAARWYYGVLIATWAVGVVGSYLAIPTYLAQFN